MLAAAATSIHPEAPLDGLTVGEFPKPEMRDGWVRVKVDAASLNHHDLWSLRGVGLPPDRLPMILGCDAAGTLDSGEKVIVHAVIGDPAAGGGDETLDPKRSLLSEVHPGTLAEYVSVPSRNVVTLPEGFTMEQAACLPTAWLTAYRMLATKSGLVAGDTVLIQGAGGGVSTALVMLGKALGLRVWVTSRDESKRAAAVELGADEAFESGARLPERVQAVMESVGEATWAHSLKALVPGGRIVTCGATSGPNPPADLNRVFFLQLSIVGSTMGTREELVELLGLLGRTGIRPPIALSVPLADARQAFEALETGEFVGKITVSC